VEDVKRETLPPTRMSITFVLRIIRNLIYLGRIAHGNDVKPNPISGSQANSGPGHVCPGPAGPRFVWGHVEWR